MSTRRHLSNAFWLTLSGALAKVLLFAASIITYKRLSVPHNGLLGFALAYGTMAALFMEAGVRGYMIRELARSREDRTTSANLYTLVLNTRFFMVVVIAPIALIIAWLLGYRGTAFVFVLVMMGYGLLDSLATLQKAVLRAYERMNYDAVVSMVGKGLLLTALWLAARTGHFKLTTIAGAYLGSSLLEVLILAVAVRSKLQLQWTGPTPTQSMLALLRTSFPFASIVALSMLYLRTAIFTLSALPLIRRALHAAAVQPSSLSTIEPDSAVAYFTTAARLPEALGFLPLAIINAMIPYLSRNRGNTAAVQSVFTTLMRYLGTIGFVTAAWFATQPASFMLLIAKQEYLAATTAFTWLAVAIPFSFLHYTTANLLISMDEEHAVVRRETVALVLNLSLNLLLVPKWTFTGAAASLAVSELVSVVLDLYVLRRHRVHIPIRVCGVWILVAAITAAASELGRNLRPLLAVLPGAGAAAACVIGVVWLSEKERLRAYLNRSST